VVSNDELHSAKLIIAVKIVQNFGNDEKPFCNSKILQLKLYPGKWTWHFATTPDRRQRIRNMDKQST
jgi:hypothetical protein